MKVLHIYPKSDELIQRHVALLAECMRQSADVRFTDSNAAFRTIFQEQQPDIVHCHGCWHYSLARAAQTARRRGARVVLTLHGQLEPWVTSEKPIQDKFGKTLLWLQDARGRVEVVESRKGLYFRGLLLERDGKELMTIATLPHTGLHRLARSIVATLGKTDVAIGTVERDNPLPLALWAIHILQELTTAIGGILKVKCTYEVENTSALRGRHIP